MYTTEQAADILKVSRQSLFKTAHKEGWAAKVYGSVRAKFWHKQDVLEYRQHQVRTALVKQLGWSGRGLYRNDDIDIECPECGKFAIEWPAPPELSEKFVCAEGHEGELL